MPNNHGDFDGEELWLRCPVCGDSDNHPDRAHYSVNIFTRQYYCFRCSGSGKVPYDEIGYLVSGLDLKSGTSKSYRGLNSRASVDVSIVSEIAANIKPGPAVSRYSALERYTSVSKTERGQDADVFPVYSLMGEGLVIGYHFRYKTGSSIGSKALTFGKRFLGIPKELKLKSELPIRIVEGPYDVLDPYQDICTFGFPNASQVNQLKGKRLILCPDGDVWEDWRKLRQFMKLFTRSGFLIDFIERIPDGGDPDEVPPRLREKLTLEQVAKMIKPKNTRIVSRMSPETILANITEQATNDRIDELWGF